jgi:membrane-associated phospholipid phosphatase
MASRPTSFVAPLAVRIRGPGVLPRKQQAVAMSRSMTLAMCAPRSAVEAGADLTKWVVSCAVGGGLLYFHDAPAILLAAGGLANAAVTKVAKRMINAPRPESAPEAKKVTAGMPSSHASSLAYFAVALVLLTRQPYTLTALVLAVIASGWRVTAKYHTVEQMLAGLALGSVNACLMVLGVMPRTTFALANMLKTHGALPVTGLLIPMVRLLALYT